MSEEADIVSYPCVFKILDVRAEHRMGMGVMTQIKVRCLLCSARARASGFGVDQRDAIESALRNIKQSARENPICAVNYGDPNDE